MSRLLVMALIAFAGLGGGFRDLYCPACERFSADEWAIDAQGLCRGCGRPPFPVEATTRSWVWCETYEEWGDEACSHDRALRCCTTWSATALTALPAEAKPGRFPFCPQCKSFRGLQAGRDGRDRCAGCGKPPVMTLAAEASWYWCRSEKRWSPTLLHHLCCVGHETRVPLVLSLPAFFPTPGGDVFVTTDWLAAHIDDLNLVLVHVEFGREASDALTRPTFNEGHIPFAHPLEWRALAATRDGLPNEYPPAAEMAEAFRRMGVDLDSRVVLYDTGAGLEAARAFVALEYLGLQGRVSLLDGHWKKWVREGRELSRVYSGVEPSAFVPALRPDVLADRRTVADFVWASLEPFPSAVVIDARPAEEFIGVRPGKGITRPGHLPGAMSVPWTSTIVSLDNPVLRPEGELRAIFEGKGARPGRRVLAYCRSGVQASHTYAVARALGYAASLYDGSYADWSGRSDLPVEMNWAMR